jgi:hypothetical protein
VSDDTETPDDAGAPDDVGAHHDAGVHHEAGAQHDAGTPDEPEPGRGPLDVLLFAPVGVVLTVAEDLPGLIAKGRKRVDQEISNARTIGAFVVRFGQKDLTRRVGQLFGQDGPDRPTPVGATDDDRVGAAGAPTATPKPVPDPADSAVVEQVFAGYDTLSASQVVRRLESLEPDHLRAVHRYEASHRNRRTILNRTQQLLEADPPGAPTASTP